MHQPAPQRQARQSRSAAMGSAAQRALVRGLSHVEALMVLAVALTVLGTALPSFEQARERRHLEGAAAQVRTAVQHARGLAVSQDTAVRLRVQTSIAGSCYVVHSGAANACSCLPAGEPVCSAGARSLHSQWLPASSSTTLSANVGSMLFDPTLGTVTPTGTVSIRSRSGAEVRQVVSVMGRVRSCSPNAVPGYAAC